MFYSMQSSSCSEINLFVAINVYNKKIVPYLFHVRCRKIRRIRGIYCVDSVIQMSVAQEC